MKRVDYSELSWRPIAVYAVLGLLVLVAVGAGYWRDSQDRLHDAWPQVPGRPIGTRIVKESPTPRFRVTMYVGECSVEYTVGSKRYAVWVGAGYLDPDPKLVSDKMEECPVSHWVVHYNPSDPADGYASRDINFQ
jgi:hypothetical protein